jgi:hypothetical protein
MKSVQLTYHEKIFYQEVEIEADGDAVRIRNLATPLLRQDAEKCSTNYL